MIHWMPFDWVGNVVDHPERHWAVWTCFLGAFAAAMMSARIHGGPGLWRFMWAEFVDGWAEGVWFWMTIGGLLQPPTWASSERMWARYLLALAAAETTTEGNGTILVRDFLNDCQTLRHGKAPAPVWRRLSSWPSWPGVLSNYLNTVTPAHHEATREAVEEYLAFVRRAHRAW